MQFVSKSCFWLVNFVLLAGCVTESSLELDSRHPSIEVKERGFYVDNKLTKPAEILEALDDMEIPKDHVIYIRVNPDTIDDLKAARSFMGVLALKGYRRSVLVTERHADSESKYSREHQQK